MQPKKWGKYFFQITSAKGLISKIYKLTPTTEK